MDQQSMLQLLEFREETVVIAKYEDEIWFVKAA